MIDDAVGDESEIAPRRSTFQAPLEENLPVGEFPVEEDPVGVETAPPCAGVSAGSHADLKDAR